MDTAPASAKELHLVDEAIRRYAALQRGWHVARHTTEERLHKQGIAENPVEIVVLHALLTAPAGELTISQLCAITGDARSTMSNIVAHAERDLFVSRGRGADNRSTVIRLTAKGEDFINRLRSELAGSHERIIRETLSLHDGRGRVATLYHTPSVAALKDLQPESFAYEYLSVEDV